LGLIKENSIYGYYFTKCIKEYKGGLVMEFNQFVSWDMLANYGMFVGIVFMVVQVIKELCFFKDIPTRAVSIGVAFVLLVLVNVQAGTFAWFNIVLYALSAIVVSLTANGVADGTIKPKEKKTE
jgi:hypothetical protein